MSEPGKCAAHSSRTGDPCRKWPISGSNVCSTHGGSAPQVKRRAEERLRELQFPAVSSIADAIVADTHQLDRRGGIIKLGPDHAVRLRAALAVLDRTGLGPSSSANVTVTASQHLADLIAELDGNDGGRWERTRAPEEVEMMLVTSTRRASPTDLTGCSRPSGGGRWTVDVGSSSRRRPPRVGCDRHPPSLEPARGFHRSEYLAQEAAGRALSR
jgi:hypothetical protein